MVLVLGRNGKTGPDFAWPFNMWGGGDGRWTHLSGVEAIELKNRIFEKKIESSSFKKNCKYFFQGIETNAYL